MKELVSQGISLEVRSLLTPLEERVQNVENTQTDVMNQLKEMVEDMKGFKEQFEIIDRAKDKDSAKQVQGVSAAHTINHVGGDVVDQQDKVREIISHARRTVGLDRIDQSDLG